jgi:hypothetical protein
MALKLSAYESKNLHVSVSGIFNPQLIHIEILFKSNQIELSKYLSYFRLRRPQVNITLEPSFYVHCQPGLPWIDLPGMDIIAVQIN